MPGPRFLRWLTRLLARAVPADSRDEVLGDLEEGWRTRVRRDGALRAAGWWAAEVGAFLVRFRWERLRRRRFGGPASPVDVLARDLRFAGRSLRRAPGFTIAATLTLALGIGATTAMFSVVHQVLVRPLPFEKSDAVVVFLSTFQDQSWWSTSPLEVREWRERNRTMAGIAFGDRRGMSLSGTGEPEPIVGARVSANLLEVLAVVPSLGRGFAPDEDRPGAAPVTVLTEGFWVGRLGADPGVIGRSLRLDGVEHTVVGVLPRGLAPDFLGDHDLLVPRILDETDVQAQGRTLASVARLAEGVSLEAAQADMERVAASVEGDGTLPPGWGVRVVGLRDHVVGDASGGLAVLALAVLLVLAVGCANVTHLMIARASDRASDVAVRRALGASRLGIARLHLAEAGLLSVGGSALGMVLAVGAGNALLRVNEGSLPRVTAVRADGLTVAVALTLSLVAALAAAAAPAALSWVAGRSTWQGLGRGARTTGGSGRTHGILVSAQLGVLVVLLSGAALALDRFHALSRVDPGFALEDRVAVRIALPPTSYATSTEIAAFFDRLVEAVSALPEVRAAGTVSNLPLTGPGFTAFHLIDGRALPRPGEEPLGGIEAVDGGYFRAIGIPLLEGRDFTSLDHAQAPRVAIVDQAMARRGWPDGQSPLGEAVSLGPPGLNSTPLEIVGLVTPVRYGLDAEPRPRVYVPSAQMPFATPARELVVWTEPGVATALVPRLREAVRAIDPSQPLGQARTLSAVASASLAEPRLRSLMLGGFAGVALALGVVGVYGLVRYSVARRHRELGVRLAVGCQSGRLVRWVVLRSLLPVAVGLLLGLAASVWTNRVLEEAMLGPSRMSGSIGAGVSLLLVVVALVAAWLPARKAGRLDVASALRIE